MQEDIFKGRLPNRQAVQPVALRCGQPGQRLDRLRDAAGVERGLTVLDLDVGHQWQGAQRVLVVDLMAPTHDLVDVPNTKHLESEADGLRQRLAFDPAEITAAAVLAQIGTTAEVRDLSIEEPDIEDVVRRIYLSRRD